MKKWLLPLIVIIVIASFWYLARDQEATSLKAEVIATSYPLWEFTKTIAGEDLNVELLVPIGSNPHHWEPTTHDFAKLANAQALICQGISFEPWVKRAANETAIIYEATPSASDPHFWLDPLSAKVQVEKIATTLSQVAPDQSKNFQGRAQKLAEKLENLHQEYKRELTDLKGRTFITTHQAFDYLAQRYNLTAVALKGLTAEGEPKPGDLMQVTNLAKKEGLTVIFKEPLENPRLAEIIAQEIGGETKILHPIGNLSLEEKERGEDYFSLMQANLSALKKALGGSE